MTITIRTHDFSPTPAIREWVESRVRSAVEPLEDRVMSVRATLEDINADRGGVDKRCLLVAVLRKSGVVVAEATDVDLYAAIDRAATRLRRAAVESTRRRIARSRRHIPNLGLLVRGHSFPEPV